MPRLTQALVIEKIKQAPALPPTPRTPGGLWVADTSLPGFYLRLWPSGKASYAVKKRLGKRVLTRTVGPAEFMDVDAARRKAAEVLLSLESGIDPLEVTRTAHSKSHSAALSTRGAHTTVGEALRQFIHERRREPSTVKDIAATFNRHTPEWLSRPIRSITQDEIKSRILQVGVDAGKKSRSRLAAGNVKGQGTQVKTAKWIRALFNWAAATEVDGEPLIANNPARVIAAKRLVKGLRRRQTRLEASITRALLAELEEPGSSLQPHEKDLLALMLFTGCRPSEVLRLRWEDIDLRNAVCVFRSTKNGSDFRLPFSKSVRALLERQPHRTGYVLSANGGATTIGAPYGAFTKASAAIGQHFSPSDLRRTWATAAGNAGVPLEVRASCMNHTLSSNVTLGYAGPSERVMRAAFDKVDRAIRQTA